MFGSDIIRVRINGFIKNITENDSLFFNEKGIYTKNKVSFMNDGIKYVIKYADNGIFMIRENDDFINSFIFNKKSSTSTYTLKDNNFTIDMDIVVKEMIVNEKLIDIKYLICDTECEYEYRIEMSESI